MIRSFLLVLQFICLTVLFHNLSPGPLWSFVLVCDPLLHTPYISSLIHHLLFAIHAHTTAACFAVTPVSCHLFLISLSQLLTWKSVLLGNVHRIHITHSISWTNNKCQLKKKLHWMSKLHITQKLADETNMWLWNHVVLSETRSIKQEPRSPHAVINHSNIWQRSTIFYGLLTRVKIKE